MVNVLRRFSQPIMVVITVLVIVSFAYWGPSITRSGSGDGDVLTVYGRGYSLEAFNRQVKKVHVFAALGGHGRMMGGEYAQAVPMAMAVAFAGQNPEFLRQIVQNALIFEREADALGITSTEKERLEQLERTPIFFDGTGKFDPALVTRFQAEELSPRGFTDGDLDSIFLHGEVRARKLRALVGSTVTATPEEIRERLIAQRMTTEASYVVFKSEDFRKDLKATDAEISAYYDKNKSRYMTEEKRRVRFAAFKVAEPADGKPIEPSLNIELLTKAAGKAYELAQALATPGSDFDALAKGLGAEIGETKTPFAQDVPPDEIEDNPVISETAFKLEESKPYSEHLTSAQGLKKGAYVLKLVEIKKSEQRPLEDCKTDAEAMVIGEKALELAKAKATEVFPKIEEAKKAGKNLAEAAESVGLKAVALPAFGSMQRSPGSDLYASVVRAEAEKLAPGKLSQPVSAQGSWLIVHVDYRSPIDEKAIEEGKASAAFFIEQGFGPMGRGRGIRDTIYENWFDERRVAAGVGKFQ